MGIFSVERKPRDGDWENSLVNSNRTSGRNMVQRKMQTSASGLLL
jgi:hypothetical protein